MGGEVAADRGERRPSGRREPACDERLREAPVGAPVGPGVAHADESAVGEAQPPRALHVKQEKPQRVVGPGELEAAAGERPALDLGTRRIGDEAPALEAAGEHRAAASGIERTRLDVDQVRRPAVDRMTEGGVRPEAGGELGLVIGGHEERLAHAHRTKEPADGRAARPRVGFAGERLEERPRGCHRPDVARAFPDRHRALDRGSERCQVEVVEQRRELARADRDGSTGSAQGAGGGRKDERRERERASRHAA